MILRIELDAAYAKQAFENAIASLKRSEGKSLNPMMLEIIRKDIERYRRAIDTMQELPEAAHQTTTKSK